MRDARRHCAMWSHSLMGGAFVRKDHFSVDLRTILAGLFGRRSRRSALAAATCLVAFGVVVRWPSKFHARRLRGSAIPSRSVFRDLREIELESLVTIEQDGAKFTNSQALSGSPECTQSSSLD